MSPSNINISTTSPYASSKQLSTSRACGPEFQPLNSDIALLVELPDRQDSLSLQLCKLDPTIIFTGVINRTTLLDVIELFETMEPEFDSPEPRDQASGAVVEELQSITREIDDLTKAILDTITLETALNSSRLRAGLSATQ